MKIAIAADHRGMKVKQKIEILLGRLGHEIVDYGTHGEQSVDYPDHARPAAEAVGKPFGVLLFKLPGFVMAALIPAVAGFAAQWSWGKYATGSLGMQLLSIPVSLLTMWAAYRLCHQLTAWRAVRVLVANATFTRFYRRYHEPSTRLAQLQETGTVRYYPSASPQG